MPPQKTRDHCFDNLKFILIFLAVLGHLLTISPDWGGWNEALYRLIYSFHMPVFLFITGWFAVYKRRTIVFHLAYLYVLFQTIHQVVIRGLLFQEPIVLDYSTPAWSLWYLVVCLFSYLLIPLFHVRGKRRRSCVLILFFLLSVLYGLDHEIGKYLSLGRFFSFLPFFALGCYARDFKAAILTFSHKLVKRLLTLGVLAASVYCLFFCQISKAVFYGSHSYAALGYSPLDKLLLQFIALLWLMFFLLVVLPKLNRPIPIVTEVGRNTLAIYLLHAFPVKIMDRFDLAADFTPVHVLGTAALILLLLGNDPVGRFFSRCCNGRWLENLWNRMEPKSR